MKPTFILAFLLFTSLVGNSQSFDTETADRYFKLLEDKNKFMGSLRIQQGNSLLYENALGYASIKDSIKNNVDTKYRIGSISKIFTATMIFQLIEEGKLSMNTKLSQFFPKIKNSEDISIKELLNHHSGIFNFTNNPGIAYIMYNENSREDLLEFIYNLEPAFEPNEKAEYSNSNYLLLGFIIEDLDKRRYSESLETRIANKLDLENTYYGKTIDVKNNEASSYLLLNEWQQSPESDMSVPAGAGAIVSTTKDLNTFIQAIQDDGKLISEASLDLMKSQNDTYGHGLFKVPFYSIFGYGHGGRIDGFTSELYHFEDSDISIAILSNGLGLELNDVLLTSLKLAYNKPVELPDFTTVKIAAEKLSQYEGVFSTEAFPLKITIKAVNGELTAQATGQGAFPLVAKSQLDFEFKAAGIKLGFKNLEDGKFKMMDFSQGPNKFTFARED